MHIPTNIAPAALQRASRGQPPARWVFRGLFSLTILLAPLALLCASWLSASLVLASNSHNLMPPLCLLQRHSDGFQLSATGWLAKAGLLCAEPTHCHQRASGGPLDVNRQPLWPPLGLLSAVLKMFVGICLIDTSIVSVPFSVCM